MCVYCEANTEPGVKIHKPIYTKGNPLIDIEEITIRHGILTVVTSDDESMPRFMEVKINYCPMCRKEL